MSKDDAPVGKPSAWSSSQPVTGSPVLHRHPLTTGVRVILVIYGLMLAMSFGGVLWVVIDGQNRDEKDRQAIAAKVQSDLDKAAAAQVKKDAATNKQTQVLVCRFLLEFKQTPNVKALSRQFKCALALASVAPKPTPAPSATYYIYRYEPAPQSQPEAAPSPRRTTPPKATRSPSDHPSPHASPTPTKSCLLPKPLPCPVDDES